MPAARSCGLSSRAPAACSKDNEVRVQGAPAGSVERIELTKRNTALVTLRLKDGIESPRRDATAAIRPVDLLGDNYITLSLGEDAAPLRGTIKPRRDEQRAPALGPAVDVSPVRAAGAACAHRRAGQGRGPPRRGHEPRGRRAASRHRGDRRAHARARVPARLAARPHRRRTPHDPAARQPRSRPRRPGRQPGHDPADDRRPPPRAGRDARGGPRPARPPRPHLARAQPDGTRRDAAGSQPAQSRRPT